MTGNQGYGASVDRDGIDSTLQPTRLQRLAVEVLLDSLTPAMTTPTIDNALWELRERLIDVELAALRTFGISHRYLVIPPINPGNLPGNEDLEKISMAIRTLANMGMITGEGLDP